MTLAGKHILVTAGPTHEPIDPVRYIANRSSGKQGHAIAAALAKLGAETLLVSGPTREADPAGVAVRHVETAAQMLAACEAALPVDVAVCAAAVADWRPARAGNQKLKKNGATTKSLELTANPDILATLAQSKTARPRLVVGFAAETEQVLEHARGKLERKGAHLIVGNDVTIPGAGFESENNAAVLVDRDGHRETGMVPKHRLADLILDRAAELGEAGVAAPQAGRAARVR